MAKVVLKLGDDISTDIIYPGRYMATVLPAETPQYAFADMPGFNTQLKEQAASCLKGPDLVIVARHFARIFLQNSINLGLRTVVCPEIEAEAGDEIELTEKELLNRTSGKSFVVIPLPAARQAIIEAGGLIPFTRRLLLQQRENNI
jgi:3-isopropylmalate/(R)-2-methylmalate dehydratase small subunit